MGPATLLLALALQDVAGLREGETAKPMLGGLPEPGLQTAIRGRLLDGVTSRPIAGAVVELWGEFGSITPGLLERGQSLADGSFAILERENERGEKLIVRADGYRSTLVARSDADEILLLPRAKHLRATAVDLEGRPIAGARAESRQTCAHAPPAFVATSDAAGRLDLSDFPPLDDEPELVVSARGYGSVLLQVPEQMLARDGMEVRLPKRRPLAFKIVDGQGQPLAGPKVSLGAEPQWMLAEADAGGRVVFDSPFFGRAFVLNLWGAPGPSQQFLASGRAPASFEPKLVFVGVSEHAAPPADDPPATLPVHVVDAAGKSLDLAVCALREHGSTRHGLEGVRLLGADWGKTTLVAGGPFTGWKESVKTLDSPAETTLTVEREPALTINLPADVYWLLHVQAGDDSITLEDPKTPLRQPVPFGKAITLCAVGEHETRLSRLGQIRDDASVDLTRTASIVQRLPVDEPPALHLLRFEGGGALGHVRLAERRVEVEDAASEVRFEVPARASYEGRLGAPGCVPIAVGPWTDETAALRLHRRGSLTVRGRLDGMHAGGSEGEAVEGGGFRVEGLAPGPLLAELWRRDGPGVAVSLVLGEGEDRELTLR